MFSRTYQVLYDIGRSQLVCTSGRFYLVFTNCSPIFRNQANSKYVTWQLSVLRIFAVKTALPEAMQIVLFKIFCHTW